MYYRIVSNDIKKSKVITATTMIFVAVAAMLVSLAAILIVNLSGAIDSMMLKAKTPHFMQMHSGEIDSEKLADFARRNELAEDFQLLEFLNVESGKIVLGKNTLANNVQDNGFSVQSEKFDYLLDSDSEVISVGEGEL